MAPNPMQERNPSPKNIIVPTYKAVIDMFLSLVFINLKKN